MTQPVPFFRPVISEAAISSVADSLRSGWLTSGPKVREFEARFAESVGAAHAVAVNSATAGLHLAMRAMGLRAGDGVLVPTHTFAATAEVIQYHGGIPVLVDCMSDTLNLDLDHADQQRRRALQGELPVKPERIVGIVPVHVAGLMIDMDRVRQFAKEHGLWVVEDAAHAFPAGYHSATLPPGDDGWTRSGQGTADATCFSFYANKTITTGEGGMMVTNDEALAEKCRCLSLHGLSSAAWRRFEGGAKWDYQITDVGFKYNLTDIAAAIGLEQLKRAEAFREARQEIADEYFDKLRGIEAIELPPRGADRFHSWHLFVIKLRLEKLSISRNQFCEQLDKQQIGFSVHWRPLHLHDHYRSLGWRPEDLPVASKSFDRIISLPIFPDMTLTERNRVIDVVSDIARRHTVSPVSNADTSGTDGTNLTAPTSGF